MTNEVIKAILIEISTGDLWAEIARRLNITYGKVQMTFHDGRPSEYTHLDIKIQTG
jgi:hypothetical protein